MLKFVERGLLVAGLGLLAFLVYELGAASVLANLRLVGWGIVPIVGQEAVAIVANTWGWRNAFPPPRPPIPFRRLMAARMSGDAVNYVTPTATIGGEFVRTRFLEGDVNRTTLIASLVVAKLSQTMAQITFITIGLALVLNDTPLPAGVRAALLSALAVFVGFVAVFLVAQRRGMFAPLLRVLQRLGVRQAPDLARRLENLDAEISRFHGHATGALLRSVACFLVGWSMGVVEIYLILWFLGVEVSVQRALTIEVMSVAIDGMMFFVPAKAGTQEGGKVLIFTALGLDPAKGLALGILRRTRELTWASIGLFIWSRHQLTPEPT